MQRFMQPIGLIILFIAFIVTQFHAANLIGLHQSQQAGVALHFWVGQPAEQPLGSVLVNFMIGAILFGILLGSSDPPQREPGSPYTGKWRTQIRLWISLATPVLLSFGAWIAIDWYPQTVGYAVLVIDFIALMGSLFRIFTWWRGLEEIRAYGAETKQSLTQQKRKTDEAVS